MPEGLRLLLLNTLNNDDYKAENEQIGVPLSHPIHIGELFTPHAQKPTKIDVNYTVTGLSKLLLFKAYAQTQTENITAYVIEEAMKYPYPRRANLPEVWGSYINLNILNNKQFFYLGSQPSRF